MRLIGAAVVVLLLAAGCAGPPEGEPFTPPSASAAATGWPGRVVVDYETGTVTAPGFNDVVDARAPDRAMSPRTAAVELLHLDRPFDGPVEVFLDEDGDEVTATLTGLGDDSIGAIRYRITFDRGADGRHRFNSGEYAQRCVSGRGHQWFAAETCS